MDAKHFHEQAYDDWFADLYDELYPQLLDERSGPFRSIGALINLSPELSVKPKAKIAILDCACGTGNNYAAFTRAGYDIWACDGSVKMLARALINCNRFAVSTEKLVREPVSWMNTQSYRRHFVEKGKFFDIIMLNSNSFCHIPEHPDFMPVALRNFKMLLKPGGRLLIDTKKYEEATPIDGVPIFKELRYVDSGWIVRTDRLDGPRNVTGLGDVYFHTRLNYDVDPYFRVCRALVIATIYGDYAAPCTKLLTYYPLPMANLKKQMENVGLRVITYEAKTPPLNWEYDFAIGQKDV